MSTTEDKTLMTDADVAMLAARGEAAVAMSISLSRIRDLGFLASAAADTIAALQEQNRALVERCQVAEADAAAWRNFGDAAVALKREAETLTKSVNADEYAAAIAEMRKKAQRWDAATAASGTNGRDPLWVGIVAAGVVKS